MRTRLALSALLTLSAPALAEDSPNLLFEGANAMIAFKDNFSVQVVDRVTDQCLPQPKKVEQAMTKALEEQGMKVNQGQPKALGDAVILDIVGNKSVTGTCLIHIQAWLNHWLVANVPYAKQVAGGNQAYFAARHPLGQNFHYAKPQKVEELISKAAFNYAARLKQDVDQARSFADTHFPAMRDEYSRLHPADLN